MLCDRKGFWWCTRVTPHIYLCTVTKGKKCFILQCVWLYETSNTRFTMWTSNMWLHFFSDYYNIKSPYSTAAVVSDQLGFHREALTDVSHYKAWRGCNGWCCSVEADWPLAAVVSSTRSESEERLGSSSKRQHVGHGVWFAALVYIFAVRLWLSVLYCRSGTLAEGLFPSRKYTSTGRVKPWQMKSANTDTRDSAATKSLWVCF